MTYHPQPCPGEAAGLAGLEAPRSARCRYQEVTMPKVTDTQRAAATDPGTKKAPSRGSAQPKHSRTAGKKRVQPAAARRSSKSETILELLRRPKGVKVAELQKAIGWQSHSVRAA